MVYNRGQLSLVFIFKRYMALKFHLNKFNSHQIRLAHWSYLYFMHCLQECIPVWSYAQWLTMGGKLKSPNLFTFQTKVLHFLVLPFLQSSTAASNKKEGKQSGRCCREIYISLDRYLAQNNNFECAWQPPCHWTTLNKGKCSFAAKSKQWLIINSFLCLGVAFNYTSVFMLCCYLICKTTCNQEM